MKYFEILYLERESRDKYFLYEKTDDVAFGEIKKEDFFNSVKVRDPLIINASNIHNLINIIETTYSEIKENNNLANSFQFIQKFGGKNNDLNIIQFYFIDETKIIKYVKIPF